MCAQCFDERVREHDHRRPTSTPTPTTPKVHVGLCIGCGHTHASAHSDANHSAPQFALGECIWAPLCAHTSSPSSTSFSSEARYVGCNATRSRASSRLTASQTHRNQLLQPAVNSQHTYTHTHTSIACQHKHIAANARRSRARALRKQNRKSLHHLCLIQPNINININDNSLYSSTS